MYPCVEQSAKMLLTDAGVFKARDTCQLVAVIVVGLPALVCGGAALPFAAAAKHSRATLACCRNPAGARLHSQPHTAPAQNRHLPSRTARS